MMMIFIAGVLQEMLLIIVMRDKLTHFHWMYGVSYYGYWLDDAVVSSACSLMCLPVSPSHSILCKLSVVL